MGNKGFSWKALTQKDLQKVRSENQEGLQDPPPQLHQGTPQGALAQPQFSDVVIGEPSEPTWAIYSEHMDLPIVRLGANRADGLSSGNWARSSLTVLDEMIQISLFSSISDLLLAGSVPQLSLRSTHSKGKKMINNVSLMVLVNYL